MILNSVLCLKMNVLLSNLSPLRKKISLEIFNYGTVFVLLKKFLSLQCLCIYTSNRVGASSFSVYIHVIEFGPSLLPPKLSEGGFGGQLGNLSGQVPFPNSPEKTVCL